MKNNLKTHKHKKISIRLFLFFLLSFFFFLGHNVLVLAITKSSIYFVEPNIAVAPGSDFSIDVLLDATEPINAIDLEIIYPKDKLKFLNFDNTHSIVNIWQESPALFSDGNIHLVGGIFKSFTGEKGLVIKLVFRALEIGQPELSFVKNNIYLADGKGTKLLVDTLISNISITKNATVTILPSLDIEKTPDDSLPNILFEQTQSPVDGATLIVFYATDLESGIKQTQMRIKKWWSYSLWQDVQNPVLYPTGAWNIEFKAINNVGLESVKSLSWMGELFKKILILFFLCIILVFGIIWVYNKKKRKT